MKTYHTETETKQKIGKLATKRNKEAKKIKAKTTKKMQKKCKITQEIISLGYFISYFTLTVNSV